VAWMVTVTETGSEPHFAAARTARGTTRRT